MKQGCLYAEIIPCEPDADNADEGSFHFFIPFSYLSGLWFFDSL